MFHYGESGVVGFTHRQGEQTAEYVYQKNLQGDVTHLYKVQTENDAKTYLLCATYAYDAWGKHVIHGYADGIFLIDAENNPINLATSAEYATHIGNLNPIRYRGYYYDTETEFYYLQSRYYDPEIGRFINADSIEYLDPETIGGLNLYAYCGNNPVMCSDRTGCYPESNGQAFDLLAFLLELGIGGGLALSGWAIKTGARPNNIGLGIFRIRQAKQIAGLTKASGILSKVSTGMAIISTGISVFEGIQKDIGRGYSTDRIVSNAITNTVVYGGLTLGAGWLGAKLGMAIGSVVPGLGNAIGAAVGFAIGIGIGLLLEWKIDGKSVIDHIGDAVYNFWNWLF